MSRKSRQQPQILHEAREAVLLDHLQARANRPENTDTAERATARGLKAVAVAPSLDICKAILRGERVHWQQLDDRQAPRYGIRYGHRRRDGCYTLDDFNDVRQ